MGDQIRVIVGDDHSLIRAGVRLAVVGNPDIVIVGEATDSDGMLERCDELRPDVLLLSPSLPGPPTTEVVARIHAHHPRTRVIVLPTSDPAPPVSALIAAGPAGCLLKGDSVTATVDAIRAVVAGERWFSPGLLPTLLAEPARTNREPLTAREEEVLNLVADGCHNAEIAAALHVSPKTVEFHIHNLLAKLHVRSRTEAALYRARQHSAVPHRPDMPPPQGKTAVRAGLEGDDMERQVTAQFSPGGDDAVR